MWLPHLVLLLWLSLCQSYLISNYDLHDENIISSVIFITCASSSLTRLLFLAFFIFAQGLIVTVIFLFSLAINIRGMWQQEKHLNIFFSSVYCLTTGSFVEQSYEKHRQKVRCRSLCFANGIRESHQEGDYNWTRKCECFVVPERRKHFPPFFAWRRDRTVLFFRARLFIAFFVTAADELLFIVYSFLLLEVTDYSMSSLRQRKSPFLWRKSPCSPKEHKHWGINCILEYGNRCHKPEKAFDKNEISLNVETIIVLISQSNCASVLRGWFYSWTVWVSSMRSKVLNNPFDVTLDVCKK
jgi:hypothetical protein